MGPAVGTTIRYYSTVLRYGAEVRYYGEVRYTGTTVLLFGTARHATMHNGSDSNDSDANGNIGTS